MDTKETRAWGAMMLNGILQCKSTAVKATTRSLHPHLPWRTRFPLSGFGRTERLRGVATELSRRRASDEGIFPWLSSTFS